MPWFPKKGEELMKIGSKEHKQLFCQSFMTSYLEYEPEKLPWSDLDDADLERLRGITFWEEALITEREAGMMVSAFAETVSDPTIRAAIALQGKEEARHARLLEFLIDHYNIQISERPVPKLPQNIEQALIDFGFGECLDSFFASGCLGLPVKRYISRSRSLPSSSQFWMKRHGILCFLLIGSLTCKFSRDGELADGELPMRSGIMAEPSVT
jgi:hypothetical protein